MADLVKLTIDGREIQAAPGTLVIDAAKTAGIEIPAFCYYEGFSLAAACRMCLVEVEKMPKMMTACTLPVAEGMVVKTDTPQVAAARKSTLEFLLTNHPLDCPVCDKGGECELQDMVFRYGAGESRYIETKIHVPEKQYSPVVFFDAPRCILCFRCIRACNEGMGVGALGVINRGAVSEIAPNTGDHLECDECGACIDICPVGALTSGTYRYQTRPWEMTHVGTICTHCGDGCKTTLGTRNDRIIRGNNRDHSGINGEFLCVKGRYAFDFYDNSERLQTPLARINGKLEEVSWSQALDIVAKRFNQTMADGGTFGVIGSNHTSNEENFYLQKFARQVLRTNHIDHHRTGDVVALVDALSGKTGKLATVADLYQSKAVLVLGADLALEHPLLSYQIRANSRHHQAHVYAVSAGTVREDKYSVASIRVGANVESSDPSRFVHPQGEASAADYFGALDQLRDKLKAETELVVLFDDSFKGQDVHKLVLFGESLGIPVKYIALVDYSNSRGAIDMGLTPELLPGYKPSGQLGMNVHEMLDFDLSAMWVVGANPYKSGAARKAGFLVVQDMFLTETAALADVVLPAASAYEKNGTVTNVTGEVQKLKRAINTMGAKPDLEIMGYIAREMGAAAALGPWLPDVVFEEIRKTVRGYEIPIPVIATGGAAQTAPVNGRVPVELRPDLVRSDHNGLFASGTLGRYSKVLHTVIESRLSR
ncbi:MAG TPA: NADH-quinone oxidoreductase subunit NuoG [Candidatus Sulfopaludibacter sp.]|jgi:NADH-quinone oxidoreductase subunit G|nr:NADH-quinone oxidoreductase subunit NuoG [Candidatus Sulfopaludibacter sp.]